YAIWGSESNTNVDLRPPSRVVSAIEKVASNRTVTAWPDTMRRTRRAECGACDVSSRERGPLRTYLATPAELVAEPAALGDSRISNRGRRSVAAEVASFLVRRSWNSTRPTGRTARAHPVG